MYLISQLATYLFLTFLLGVGVGYTLWRTWGQREIVAKFNAAEMRLAAHLARWEKASGVRSEGEGREVSKLPRAVGQNEG